VNVTISERDHLELLDRGNAAIMSSVIEIKTAPHLRNRLPVARES